MKNMLGALPASFVFHYLMLQVAVGTRNLITMLQAGKRPQPEDIHPAYLGYFHRKRINGNAWDASVREAE